MTLKAAGEKRWTLYKRMAINVTDDFPPTIMEARGKWNNISTEKGFLIKILYLAKQCLKMRAKSRYFK